MTALSVTSHVLLMTNIPADQPLGGGWETVGRCVNRALHDLEPERSRRLDGLVNIGIDETSYKKGHKYITVIVNHDTNTVVWASEGHGKSVLEKFYKQLTPEQLSSIKVVTGDGAKWITECVNEYNSFQNCLSYLGGIGYLINYIIFYLKYS